MNPLLALAPRPNYEDVIPNEVKRRIRHLAISFWKIRSYLLSEEERRLHPYTNIPMMPYDHLRQYKALECIYFVASYKFQGRKQPLRPEICEDSEDSPISSEDSALYQQFLELVDLCKVTYPDWKAPEVRFTHFQS
jgi:hypothetical protein